MKAHRLKTWPQYLSAVITGEKKFELRKDDRKFEEGDYLILEGWNPDIGQYTNATVILEVVYILRGPAFGLKKGFVIMSCDIVDDQHFINEAWKLAALNAEKGGSDA